MILVTGATGNAGGALVRTLAGRGAGVRALVRRPVDLPAEVTLGDLNDPASVAGALAGVRGVFLLSGYDRMAETLAAVARAGVEHLVLLSASAAEAANLDNPVSSYHVESEALVREAGVPWTVLRPRTFMSNTLRWADQVRAGKVVRETFPEVSVATIDPLDIAAVAAASLLEQGHAGQVYGLTGPRALRPADRARLLGEALGREVPFEGLSDAEARTELLATMPQAYAEAFYGFFARGELDESAVLPTVEQVTGRPPRTFEEWAVANAEVFR
ncbi:NAD(P)H-binding protein [Nonomuraea diastatica]|uniref:NAD-dependent epimerase/dehydratase family protein n=1 Tax=Nonomuraea diastatica TaxID=1848329 RepID=A0A4R4WDG2_9ACTN|nr:NAD(P)H-binding protein [Nonomuraea diastatica]TDD17018.1 NAD-dependent epimerase/dehydratase family protein [Nonomuraea diastatica]